MYKEDLALNNQQWLICHKTQTNYLFSFFFFFFVIILSIIKWEGKRFFVYVIQISKLKILLAKVQIKNAKKKIIRGRCLVLEKLFTFRLVF